MPPERPREHRLLRKAREALVAGGARIARLAREPRRSRAFRELGETRLAMDQRVGEFREFRATTDVREPSEAGEFTLDPEETGPRSFQDGRETRLAILQDGRETRMATGRLIREFVESVREARPELERQLRDVEDAVTAREARESEWDREIEEQARRAVAATQEQARIAAAATQEPILILNRATTLLACICLLRFRLPHLSDSFIAVLLRHNFPEIAIHARDIETLFHATCLNRPSWVRNMRRQHAFEERRIGLSLIAFMQRYGFAHMPQMPQQRYRDRREAIRYLQDLVGAHNGEGAVNSPDSEEAAIFEWDRPW